MDGCEVGRSIHCDEIIRCKRYDNRYHRCIIVAPIAERKVELRAVDSIPEFVLPLAGFVMGDWSADLFSVWSNLLSGVMLAMIGIHMLLHDDDQMHD